MGLINLSILVERIKKKLETSGFIKDTDYASSSEGGTIKVDSTYATDITSGGKLKAKEITAEGYSEANDGAFISKATLDNLIESGALGGGGITIEKIYDKIPTYPSSSAEDASVSGKTFAGYSAYIVGVEGQNSTYTDFGATIPYEVVSTAKASVTIDSLSISFELNGTFDKMWMNTDSQWTKKLRIFGVK